MTNAARGLPRWFLIALASFLFSAVAAAHETTIHPATREHFEWLSKNGNSNCSVEFLKSIPKLPASARLQGSCCGPMDLEHYAEQLDGLKKLAAIEVVPPDPYDLAAPLAQQGLNASELKLEPKEQVEFDYAMQHADEGGPCCCRCWRWQVYTGLAKLLIRDQGFTGPQIAEFWDLSSGCGGTHDHG